MQSKKVFSAKSLIYLNNHHLEDKVLLVIAISWLTQESFGLKPVWQLFKRLLCIIKLKMLSNLSFSNVFEGIGNTYTS